MMIVCFRRFAGFTSFISKRHRSHFCSIGPGGILASRTGSGVACFSAGRADIASLLSTHPAGQHGDRYGDEPQEDDERGPPRHGAEERRAARVVPADRLEHAPDAVVEVEAETGHRDHVEERDVPDGEAGHDVVVDREVLEFARSEADPTGRQVQQVIDDERDQDHAAPARRPGRVRGRDRLLHVVVLRTRRPAHPGELYGSSHVQGDAGQEHDARHPEEGAIGEQRLPHRAEEDGVPVDGIGPEEDLQVAEHVPDDEADEDEPRDRYDHLLADHGLPQRDGRIARPCAPRLQRGMRYRANERSDRHSPSSCRPALAPRRLHGNIRQFDITVSVTSSSSSAKAIFVIASANPFACAIVAFGGIASTFGSVTTSSSAGPLHPSTRSSAGRTCAGSSTRTPSRPTACARAAKFGFLSSQPWCGNPATSISSWTMPSVWLLKRTILTGSSCWPRVRSSPISMASPPSPESELTWRSGYATWAPIACGSAFAIEPWLNDPTNRRPLAACT